MGPRQSEPPHLPTPTSPTTPSYYFYSSTWLENALHAFCLSAAGMSARAIAFVSAGHAPEEESTASGIEPPRKRPHTSPHTSHTSMSGRPLAQYVKSDRFAVLVTDPRRTDIISQSFTFNAATHEHMQADSARCAAFAAALQAHAKDRVALEIGTGPRALLAVMAAHSGARRVYAIEGDPTSAASARRYVEQLVRTGSLLANQVVVVEKLSTALTRDDVPETVQLLLHECLGTFASSEGVSMLELVPRTAGCATPLAHSFTVRALHGHRCVTL